MDILRYPKVTNTIFKVLKYSFFIYLQKLSNNIQNLVESDPIMLWYIIFFFNFSKKIW